MPRAVLKSQCRDLFIGTMTWTQADVAARGMAKGLEQEVKLHTS